MAQTYQRGHYDYDSFQRSERRHSHAPLLTVDRGLPYVAYTTRTDPKNCVITTTIHDVDQDSDHGGSRKRTSIACGRCRRRKIKCSGGRPCQACRSAGVDPSTCQYERVGTNQTFSLESSIGGPSPISSYSPISPAGAYPPQQFPTDDRSSYNRAAYPQTQLPGFSSYDTLDAPNYSVGEDPRGWTSAHRPSTTMGYYESEPAAAYDYPTPMSRISSNASEPLSPLNMSSLQSSLPPPMERRLPAPNLVGSPITPENDIRSPISTRLASLCISTPYSRPATNNWAVESVERRQPSIQDLADASMLLPPVTRGLNPSMSTLPALNQDLAPMSSNMYNSSGEDTSPTNVAPQNYYPTAGNLPPLTTNMLPPTIYGRYANASTINTSTEARQNDTYYGWTTANATHTTPSSSSIDSQSNKSIRNDSVTSQSSRCPPIHHPQPKMLPSSSHASALEKHDRVRGKEEQRRGSGSGQGKTSGSSGSGSGHGKKTGGRHKGSL